MGILSYFASCEETQGFLQSLSVLRESSEPLRGCPLGRIFYVPNFNGVDMGSYSARERSDCLREPQKLRRTCAIVSPTRRSLQDQPVFGMMCGSPTVAYRPKDGGRTERSIPSTKVLRRCFKIPSKPQLYAAPISRRANNECESRGIPRHSDG